MEIDRRTLLAAFAGAPLLSLVAAGAEGAPRARTLYVSARAERDRYFVAAFDAEGKMVFDLPLPARGHSSAFHPFRPEVVHFARRPGTFARVVDLRAGRFVGSFEAPSNRHFYGHGVFSPDGALLYATENDFEKGAGAIGVYAADEGYRRTGEIPFHGLGPHDLHLLGDGKTLVVANGGIRTRPDLPRMKLNLPTMRPSLAYLDRHNGDLLELAELAPDLHQLSIRHLDVNSEGLVAIAMQDEGPSGRVSPLIGTHRRGEEIRLFDEEPEALRSMRQYCGSISFDVSGKILAATSPRGSIVTLWSARSGEFLHGIAVADGCGIAAASSPAAFLASSGEGNLFAVTTSGEPELLPGSRPSAGSRWDNHVVSEI